MASPLLGIAGVNSLLFASFAVGKRIISPFPDLSIAQIAAAGAFAGGVNSILASPGELFFHCLGQVMWRISREEAEEARCNVFS